MVSHVESIPEYSVILQIIPRSKFFHSTNFKVLTFSIRVLISTIRNNGECPCPRCLVRKPDIPKLGMVTDMRNRIQNARTDTDTYWYGPKQARHYIYNRGFKLDGAPIERMLKPRSLVATEVNIQTLSYRKGSNNSTYRTRFPLHYRHMALTCLRCFESTFCTKLSLGYSKMYSRTWSEFYMLEEMNTYVN